ncbi:Porin-like protein NicP precursor [compost metagenome]
MTRYIRGTDATVIGSTETGKEWERNSEMRYVFQSGALKNLSLRYRNASYRSSFSRDIDENRFIIGYTIPLL